MASENKEDKLEINNDTIKTCLLSNVQNVTHGDLLISLLEANGIYAMKSFQSSGSYLNILHGFNYQGVDIVVAEKDLVRAKEILEVYQNEAVEYENGNEEFDDNFMIDNEFNGNNCVEDYDAEAESEYDAERLEKDYLKNKTRNLRILIWIFFLLPIIIGGIVMVSELIR